MFTQGFCVKEMLLHEVVTLKLQIHMPSSTFRITCIRFEIFNSKFIEYLVITANDYKDYVIYKALVIPFNLI